MERDGCYLSDLHALIGTIGVAVPHLRPGTCLPPWLVERCKRAGAALIPVVADCYLAGVCTHRRTLPTRRRAGAESPGGRARDLAVVPLAIGMNGDGHREVLGMRVATSETGAVWNGFLAGRVARVPPCSGFADRPQAFAAWVRPPRRLDSSISVSERAS